jgi:hypothetical protein
MRIRQSWGSFFLLLAAGLTGHPEAGRGQDLGNLIAQCGASSEGLGLWCQQTALAAQAAQGALGLAASGGTDLPGSASTLGWRMKGSPRIGISFRGMLSQATLPSLESTGSGPDGDKSASIPALHVSATVGLFDGFFLGPTVGGFGSIDLTATGQWIAPPKGAGFQENVLGWGIGGRLGILRESFSLPGISLSVARRFLGESSIFQRSGGDPAEAEFDLEVTSIRGVVGKDIAGIGLLAGGGWDRYSGDVSLRVDGPSGESPGTPTLGAMTSDRLLYFLGASMTFLALQVSGEVGQAEGFDPTLPFPGQGGFDPSGRTTFGSLSFRVTF